MTNTNTTAFSVHLLSLFNPHDASEFYFNEARKGSGIDKADISLINYRFVVVGETMKQISPVFWLERKECAGRPDSQQ